MQAMDDAIEAIRANCLSHVQLMDGQKFHDLRRKCLSKMTECAMMMNVAWQDAVIDGINRTEDIVCLPGHHLHAFLCLASEPSSAIDQILDDTNMLAHMV